MKIIGYQKDFFDQMVYTYGVDESVRLDRTKFIQGKHTVNYNPENLSEFINDLREIRFENEFHKKFFNNLPYNWRDVYYEKDEDLKNYRKLISILKYNHFQSPIKQLYFYFDGYIYLAYYKAIDKELKNDYWGSLHGNHFYELDGNTIYDVYKSKINLLCDETGNVVRVKAPENIIDISQKHKVPYFAIHKYFFFPFVAFKDHEKFFDVVEVYQKIENFLVTCEIEEMELQSNDNKITAHGFDLKKSFRKEKGQ